jgi:hypothetical protein
MLIPKLTNEVIQTINKIASCEKIKIPKNVSIPDQIHHLMIRCEMMCPKYFSCELIARANDILIELEGI